MSNLARQGVGVNGFFHPAQDQVATQIIRQHHALDLVRGGQIEQAIPLLNREWVSLPGGSQQAKGLTVEEARRRFDKYLAEYMSP